MVGLAKDDRSFDLAIIDLLEIWNAKPEFDPHGANIVLHLTLKLHYFLLSELKGSVLFTQQFFLSIFMLL